MFSPPQLSPSSPRTMSSDDVEVVPLHIAAFDVETPGCRDPPFAVGAVVLDSSNDKVVASFKAYNYDPKYVTFEKRCWDFWGKPAQADVLRAMTVKHDDLTAYEASQKKMVRDFFSFISEWQAKLGTKMMLVTDTTGFDQEVMNRALVACGLEDEFMPIPYNNGARRPWMVDDDARLPRSEDMPKLRPQSTTAPYGLIRSTTSMIHGFLMSRGIVTFDEPIWGVSKKFYEAFPRCPAPPVHSHLPEEDAHGIAHTLSQMFHIIETERRQRLASYHSTSYPFPYPTPPRSFK